MAVAEGYAMLVSEGSARCLFVVKGEEQSSRCLFVVQGEQESSRCLFVVKDEQSSRCLFVVKGDEQSSRCLFVVKGDEQSSRCLFVVKGDEQSSRCLFVVKGGEQSSRCLFVVKGGEQSSRCLFVVKGDEQSSRCLFVVKGEESSRCLFVVKGDQPMLDKVAHYHARLQAWDMSRVKAHVVAKGFFRADEVDAAEREYKRFLALGCAYMANAVPVSARVDEFWHAHILFTEDYAAMCDAVLGQFMHHRPEAPDAAEPTIEELAPYIANFGQPDPAWWGTGNRVVH